MKIDSLPRFTGPRQSVVEDTVLWTIEAIQRRLPSPEWIERRFLQRTIAEVIDDGFTLAYGACTDRALAGCALLGLHEIESFVVLHQFGPLRAGAAPITWHLVVEVPLEDGSWMWFDHLNRETRIREGRYEFAIIPDDPIGRLLRTKGPRYSAQIWDSRPPVRMLEVMGVDLRGRLADTANRSERYRANEHPDVFDVTDRIVRSREDSDLFEFFEGLPYVSLADPGIDVVDLTNMHLYLEVGEDEGGDV